MKEISDAFNLICRLCLDNPKKLINIFDEKNDLRKKFLDFTEIQANEFDRLPQNICLKCFKKIDQFFKFKTDCSEADFLLKEKLEELLQCNEDKKLPEIKLIKKSERIRTKQQNDVDGVLIKQENPSDDFFISEFSEEQEDEEDIQEEQEFEMIVDVDVQIKNEEFDENDEIDNGNLAISDTVLEKRKNIKQRRIYAKPESPCHICGKLIERCKLEYHINQHNGITPYICTFEECGKTFSSPFKLTGHKKHCHTDFFRFKCEICGKQFKVKTSYDIHKSYHGDPQIPCPVCGKLIRNNRAVKKHMMSHTGERPYPCNFCPKAFANPYNLKVHLRTHTGDKPFICSKCGERFGYNSLLKAHTEKHHPEDILVEN